MNDNQLPPMPFGQNKKTLKKAKKLQRMAANVPLPQTDGEDFLMTSDNEQASAPQSEPPVSSVATPPAVHVAQAADVHASFSAVLVANEPGKNSEVSVGKWPMASKLIREMKDMPIGMVHPFQDTSLALVERVSAFNHFDWQVKSRAKEWNKLPGPKPLCPDCGRKHPPPCLKPAELAALAAAMKEGKALRDELNSARMGPPTLPMEEMLVGEVAMARSKNGFTPWTPKTVFCRTCAKFHPGGAKECKVPFCIKGCGLNHPPVEPCGNAVKRFAKVTGVKAGDAVHPENPEPAKASGGIDTEKFGAFLSALDNTPENMNAAGSLFATMVRKRPAEESAEKPDSKNQKKGARGQSGSVYGRR